MISLGGVVLLNFPFMPVLFFSSWYNAMLMKVFSAYWRYIDLSFNSLKNICGLHDMWILLWKSSLTTPQAQKTDIITSKPFFITNSLFLKGSSLSEKCDDKHGCGFFTPSVLLRVACTITIRKKRIVLCYFVVEWNLMVFTQFVTNWTGMIRCLFYTLHDLIRTRKKNKTTPTCYFTKRIKYKILPKNFQQKGLIKYASLNWSLYALYNWLCVCVCRTKND